MSSFPENLTDRYRRFKHRIFVPNADQYEELATYGQNPEMFQAAVNVGRGIYKSVRLSSTAVAAFIVLVGDEASPYLDQLRDGENLSKGAPAHTVRAWSVGPTRGRSSFTDLSAIFAGWAAFRSGSPLRNVRPWYPGRDFPYAAVAAATRPAAVAA